MLGLTRGVEVITKSCTSLRTGSFVRQLGKRENKEKGRGRERENEPAWMTFNLEFFQYAEILAILLVKKCEVGGQRLFVHNSFQITVYCDTKKVIAEI